MQNDTTIQTPDNLSRSDAFMNFMDDVSENPSSIPKAAALLSRGNSLRIGFDGVFQSGRTQFEFDEQIAFLAAHDPEFVEGIEKINHLTSSVLRFAKFIRNK